MTKKRISIGPCPIGDCKKMVYYFDRRGQAVDFNHDGMHFWVLDNTGHKLKFAICKDCFEKLTMDQVVELMDNQIYTWGQEILNSHMSIVETYKQFTWFIEQAIFLKPVKWAKEENGIQAEPINPG